MFVSDKVVFVELQKTACTHIGKLLASIVDGEQIGKHNAPGRELVESGRFIIGSIRNPWEWYISLWAYGCDHRGGLYEQLTTPVSRFRPVGHGWSRQPASAARLLLANIMRGRNPEVWADLYSDVRNVENFRTWLRKISTAENTHEIGENYFSSQVSRFAGLMTFRYIGLFCSNTGNTGNNVKVNSIQDIQTFEKERCFVNYFIRSECLEKNFIEAMELAGINLPEAQKEKIFTSGKTNTSSRNDVTGKYYDEDTISIILDREKMIIDRFEYTAPESAG